MREVGFAWCDPASDLDGLIDAEMSWVAFMTEGIDDQRIHTLNLVRDFIRHCAAVAQVSDELLAVAREEIAVHDGVPVRHRQRSDLSRSEAKRPGNDMGFGL